MITPKFLQPGDTIAITSPSGFATEEVILMAKSVIENQGYRVKIVGEIIDQGNYFAADDAYRTKCLQECLDDPEVSAILMARGGYGMSRIIDDLDFKKWKENPSWICGFSDITVLHSHIQKNFGIATLHSPMCSSFTEENVTKGFLQSFFLSLQGKPSDLPIPKSDHYSPSIDIKGTLVGGNLAMLAHLSGSNSAIDTDDKLLFIEDVGEYLYNIDRMLYNLKRSGKLSNIKALLCGGFTDIQDTTRPFGKNVKEIIEDHFKNTNIPIIFDLPVGHIPENYTLTFGRVYQLIINSEKEISLTIN